MLGALCSKWWCLFLRGLCAVIAGVFSVMHPHLTFFLLVIVIGVNALIDGLVCIFLGFHGGTDGRSWWEMILLGLIGVGFGIAALVQPGTIALVLLSFVAAWAIVRGIFEIIVAIRLRKEIEEEWLLGISGVLSIAFGALLLAKPIVGLAAIGAVIGVFLFVFGVMWIALSFRLRGMQKRLATT
jgi:uncharacterized membrane protein HdeD (DUF308 family)